MSFFSREIVFLFPDNHDEMNSFFENLLDTSSSAKPLIGVPSNILASINVEIPGDVCNSLNSFIFQYEGEKTLPYMDMLNTITKIADFHGLNARFDDNFKNNHITLSASAVAKSMLRQYVGHIYSGHKYLLRYFFSFPA